MLIRLHEAGEQARDTTLNRKILKLHRDSARRRELPLPPVNPTP